MDVKVINNMPFEEYLALDRMSSSALKNFIDSPATYMWKKGKEFAPSKAFQTGTMVHTWMLENHRFQNEYYIMPELVKPSAPSRPPGLDGRKDKLSPEYIAYKEKDNAYKAAKKTYEDTVEMYIEQAGDRIIICEVEIAKYKHLPNRTDTQNEVTVLFEINGVPCKARFDMLHRNEGAPKGIEDLKTIANIRKIDRDFANFKYYIQGGFYCQAYFAAFGEWPEFFNFTFVSTADFVEMITCEVSHDYIEFGRMMVLDEINYYKECLDTDKWPGLSGFEIQRPVWL